MRAGARGFKLALWIGMGVLLGACATTSARFGEDLEDYAERIDVLENRLGRNPNDIEALRDLGIIYLRTNTFGRANEFLQAAFTRTPDDPKLLFHLGLVNEALGRPEQALRVYERFPEFSRLSPYRRLMAGRYKWVTNRVLENEVAERLAEEQRLQAQGTALCQAPPDSRILAVYPLDYQGSDERYAVLGRGLAEMLTVDLGHVDELQLVERARLQDVLNEIALASGEAFDPTTAPRVGCLVGAGRLVGGVYNVLGTDLQLDASLWDADAVAAREARSGAVSNLFLLEKELVFRLIDQMGISLTPEEREAIEFIPTQDLQAFLAYSRGLEREDAGAYAEAAQFYSQATSLDPDFSEAVRRAEEAEGMTLAPGTPDQALLGAATLDSELSDLLALAPSFDALGYRAQQLNMNLGAGVVPGVDSRNPASEAVSGGALNPGDGTLPDPPLPPPVNN